MLRCFFSYPTFIIEPKKIEPEKISSSIFYNYSLRSATTGSFFAALREGIKPETSVSPMLIATRIIAALNGKTACNVAIPVSAYKIMLMGTQSK